VCDKIAQCYGFRLLATTPPPLYTDGVTCIVSGRHHRSGSPVNERNFVFNFKPNPYSEYLPD
jgi:hypothetical protein